MSEKKSTTLSGVHESFISDSKTRSNLSLVRTELPSDLAVKSKYTTGFIAVPKFDVHKPQDSKFAGVELHDAAKNMSIQYVDKETGDRQTAQVTAEALITAHREAKAAYKARKAVDVEVKKPAETQNAVQMGA